MPKTKTPPPLQCASDFARFMERELQDRGRYSTWELWDKWMRQLLAVLQQDEEAFDAAAKRCPEANSRIEVWSVALREAFRNAPYEDHLGAAYMAVGRNNTHMGQYFTSGHIASLMARLILTEPAPDGPAVLTACEPCCGSGVMILAAEGARQELADPRPMAYWAMDLDPTCCRMTAIQTAISGIPALVLCANSLTFPSSATDTAELIHPAIHDPRIGRVKAVTDDQTRQVFAHIQGVALELHREKVAAQALPATGT